MQFSYYNPVRVLFGEGRFDELGKQAAQYGRHALLVTGRSAMRKSGWLDRALSLLEDAGVQTTVFDKVIANPTDAIVNEGADLARRAGCDLVVGLGGGSSMDSAKAIAVKATHDEPVAHFIHAGPWGEPKQPTSATLPVLCVTSTAGTSSEITPFAVVTLLETKKKAAIRSDAIYARVAIDDPRLTYSVPPRVTAATGVDVFCHAVEGFLSTQRQAITDVAAPRAIALVLRWLPEAVAHGDNAEAREQMLLANVLAGYALSQSGATALHGLEHPVSAHHPRVAHGEGLAAMLPGYLRAMVKFAPERLAELAEALRLPTDGPARTVATRVVEAAEELLEQIGLRLTLSELGVEDDELESIIEGAQDYMSGALVKTPGGAVADVLMEILQQSL